jgi:hypothetical protein
MAAPVTSVLDNFNRANGAPGANWVQAVSSYSLPNIVSSTLLDWPQFPSAAWATQFSADQEAFVKVAGAATGVYFLLRFAGLNTGAESGYLVYADPGGSGPAEAFKWSSGAASAVSLGFENGVIQSTDLYLWAEIIDNTLKIYGSSDGVTYTLRKTWTDATYDRSGYIGLYNPNNVTASTLDNFGGGTIASLTLDTCQPDADVVTTGWTSTPLFSKVNDASDATVIQATAS